MRSGITWCVARAERLDALDRERRVADAFDPRAHGDAAGGRDRRPPAPARSSRARVVPRARVAAIIRFSVPVTVGIAKRNRAPRSRVGADVDVAVVEGDRRPERLEAGEVLIDRPHADRATAGQRDAAMPASRHQRPEHQHARAHRLDQIVGRVVRARLAPRLDAQDAIAPGAADGRGGRAGGASSRRRARAARRRARPAGRRATSPRARAARRSWRLRRGRSRRAASDRRCETCPSPLLRAPGASALRRPS